MTSPEHPRIFPKIVKLTDCIKIVKGTFIFPNGHDFSKRYVLETLQDELEGRKVMVEELKKLLTKDFSPCLACQYSKTRFCRICIEDVVEALR